MGEHYITLDREFCEFIEDNKEGSLYIATDNAETYNKFQEKYEDRVLIKEYHPKGLNESAVALRKTSLWSAVIDLFMCINANKFLGTQKSSFTDTIQQIRMVDTESEARIPSKINRYNEWKPI